MINNNSTIIQSYQDLKSKLIKLAVEGSKNLTTFALLEEMVELQAQFCFSPTELMRYSDEVLTLKCHLLHKKLNELVNDLADYNITKQNLNIFQQTIEDFQILTVQITLMQRGLVENEPA